jgi:protein-tyrosine phosphatase
MGNICRSPSAEGFFERQLRGSSIAEQVSIDSAGTHSYHIGHAPDPRAIETGLQFDVQIAQLRARKVTTTDFHNFDLIIAMDRNNLADLQAIRPADSSAELKLMLAWHPEHQSGGQSGAEVDEVPDPYYGGMHGFVHMYELLEAATAGLLKDIETRPRQEL